ncbi:MULTISPECIES: cation diffusion facilitator family transporter [Enterococcus]|uniref:Cation diffusion facilitator family transporter n=1 Tax=Enterococcus alishanensis TaxID=1303817 RepID=A0ABS6TFM0_9ENTE|nr:cation diffusion facilitator family transporter [Enterococcus alishanensis]MBV7391673.1 cation diffusion facilitator family transporter [Enterococcus alishanensis]
MNHHGQQKINRAFKIGMLINLVFVIVEATIGFTANSLSLIADAGHNLSDVLGLLVAWVALILSQRTRDNYRTYGYKRSSILAALFNAVFLLIAVGGILLEAFQRLGNVQPVQENSVMLVAGVGILINGFTAFLFMKDQAHDLNVRGAFLHMAADTLVSVGVVVAAFIIKFTNWYWLDPVISIAIAVIIFVGTWRLLKESLDLSLDAVPKSVNYTEVEKFILQQPTVKSIHDLHIWALSTTENALTVHIIRENLDNYNQFIEELDHQLTENFPLNHVTMQIELGKITDESVSHSI